MSEHFPEPYEEQEQPFEADPMAPDITHAPRTYEDWRDVAARLEGRRDRILDICSRIQDDTLIDTPWYNFLLGKLHMAQQQVMAYEAEAGEGAPTSLTQE
jgi:hypothetical protein